ncbi:uncharacterized protein LOC134834407 [Culicoides brevitarsis]|uniref:uncharacterized protein LOC134834407 n=1 Tax=Culicoides brevitarsis TaxID=469753 RepID=UPI00307BF31A
MDKPVWITVLLFLVTILPYHETSGQSDFTIELHVQKYVEKGSSVTLFCEHTVADEDLYKVTWFKNSGYKLFEYIKGRTPPFRNFTIPGGEIDWSQSNDKHLTLRNLHFEAAGTYYCEVTTDTPIFSKESADAPMHVILPQTGPPRITFKKRQFFISEKLVANCTTTRAQPAPHITWLINGKKANESDVKALHPLATAHRPKNYDHSKTHNPIKQLRNMMSTPNRGEPYDVGSYGFEIHPHGNYDNNFDVDTRYHGESYLDKYDNNRKPFEKLRESHRQAHSKKYRRYVPEASSNIGNSGSSSVMHKALHKPTISSSQLSVAVSELEPGSNGKLEITCLATIPAHVGPGEQYADYKTYSVKIEIEKPELTSTLPSMSGPAASIGNGAQANGNGNNNGGNNNGGNAMPVSKSFSMRNQIAFVCLPTILLSLYRFTFYSYTI